MSKIKMFLTRFALTVVVVSFIAGTGLTLTAQEFDNKPVADELIGSGGITWVPKINYAQLVLTISRPDGTVFSKTFDSGTAPYVSLSDLLESQYIDGSYTYELRAVSFAGNKIRRDNGFPGLSRETRVQEPLTQTGYFTVRDGMIITPGAIEPRNVVSTAQDGLSSAQDQVILDDLIVDGSLCVGLDCINGESFGFDTIRLKENNLRIRFYDTSNTASFPSNDWQITANDSASGGANRFSIDDIDSGKTPFTIEAGTRANALYVDDSGRVGLGTSTPAEDLHIWYGDTPTIRLHQSGSGWAPQTWDVAGNEANFFIRDVTNGSTLPIRIRPGAPTSAIDIAANGNVGMGTSSPGYALHVKRTGANAAVLVERDGGAINFMNATATYGNFGTVNDIPVQMMTNSVWRMRLNTNNSLELASGATCTTGGVWTSVSSREAKENIRNLTSDEAMEALDGLTPVKFNYKVEKEEEYVGFIAEDVPGLVATKDRKRLTSMDIVAVLTKVLKEQQKTISKLEAKVSALEKKKQTQ
jgi:hypothetical protein